MNVFFCAHDIVEYDGNNYYSNPISCMVERYADNDGEILCYASIRHNNNPKSQKITRNNIRFIDAPQIKGLLGLFQIKNYINSIENYMKDCDVAIIHIHVSIINSLCVYVAEKIKIPYMTVVVGCAWDALWNHSVKGKLMAPICFFLEKWCQKKSKYSIYVTKYFLQSRYPTNGKSIACSNVELNFKRKLHSRDYNKNGILHIATVAAVDVRYKGQQYVIEAVAKLRKEGKKIVYHLVGDGDNSFLKKYAEKLGIADYVIFHGPLPHDAIADFLDTIDVYIQPSKQEGLPRSVIEAMSRGCLCMGSNIAGIPELLDPQYLFDAGDTDKIVKILSQISKAEISRQGKLNIEKSMNYSKQKLDEKRNSFLSNFKKAAKS